MARRVWPRGAVARVLLQSGGVNLLEKSYWHYWPYIGLAQGFELAAAFVVVVVGE